MSKSAVERIALMIWVAKGFVDELVRRQGKRRGAGGSSGCGGGRASERGAGAAADPQTHVGVEQAGLGGRRGRQRPSSPRSRGHTAPAKDCWLSFHPVILYIHLVIVKIEVVSNTEPVSTLLAGETLKMVNIGSGSHHHLKGGNHLKREVYCDLLFNLFLFFYLSTSSTVAGRAKESEVVALAQQEVPLRVQRLTNLIEGFSDHNIIYRYIFYLKDI